MSTKLEQASQPDTAFQSWLDAANRFGFAFRDILGQDAWTVWTPARTGFTEVGTPVLTGRFRIVGRKCEAQVKIVPGTTVASVAGTSYISMPVAAKGLTGIGVMENGTTNVAIGVCSIDVTNSRIYTPAQLATANTMTVWAEWEI